MQQLDYRSALGGGGNHRDISHDTSLALVWTPGKQWQVSTTLQQSSGTSQYQPEYVSNQLSLSAQFSY
jgi:hypothetical protein